MRVSLVTVSSADKEKLSRIGTEVSPRCAFTLYVNISTVLLRCVLAHVSTAGSSSLTAVVYEYVTPNYRILLHVTLAALCPAGNERLSRIGVVTEVSQALRVDNVMILEYAMPLPPHSRTRRCRPRNATEHYAITHTPPCHCPRTHTCAAATTAELRSAAGRRGRGGRLR
jgi:hypothetical protein